MNVLKYLLFAAFAIGLSACSTTYNLPKPPNLYTTESPYPAANVPPARQTAYSEILYVTDRKPETSKQGNLEFGQDRSPVLQYGTARVEFGEDQSWDNIVAAANSDIKRVKLKETVSEIVPEGQYPATPLLFTVQDGVSVIDPAQEKAYEDARLGFQAFVREALSESTKKDVIIFIHGFNVSFDVATFTTNDLYHYAGRTAVPIVYTWPADTGNILGYLRDKGSADYTVYHLKEFFRSLMAMPEIENIHVIAHSLGTQATTSALRELLIEARAANKNPLKTFNIENLIMAAPDLDYGVVTQRLIAEQFAGAFGRITVYTNHNDKALSLSSLLQAGMRFGKLLPDEEGFKEKEIFQRVKNVSFVSVRGSTPGFTNHAYFVKDPNALSDIVSLINNPSDPGTETRPLTRLEGNFWELDENYLKPRSVVPEITN